MERSEIIERNLLTEVSFYFSRSGGVGGQNVNKVNTKAELRFNIQKSEKLSEEEKKIIISKAKSVINNELELIITAQESRSQLENRKICIEKFYMLIEKCTKPVKKRVKTKRSATSVQRRLTDKSKRSDIKTNRSPRINWD